MTPPATLEAVEHLMTEHYLTIWCACAAVNQALRNYYYQPRLRDDAPVMDTLNLVVAENPRWGLWKCHDRLGLVGHLWNPMSTHRVYWGMWHNQS